MRAGFDFAIRMTCFLGFLGFVGFVGARRQDGRIIASSTIRRDQPLPAIAKRPSARLMALNAW